MSARDSDDRHTDRCPLALDAMLDHLSGELSGERADRVEEHLFACQTCGTVFESLAALGRGVREAVRAGGVAASVDGAFLRRAARDGLVLREYRIAEGEEVSCRAGAEDLVIVRLAAELGDLDRLRLETELEDLERRKSTRLPPREVVVDRELGEVLLAFPGDAVRAYPRSLWTLRLLGEPRGDDHVAERTELGPFVMDHSPG